MDGTTGEKWIQGAICFHGRMVQVFLITQVILLDYYNQDTTGTSGIVGMGFNNEDSITDLREGSFNYVTIRPRNIAFNYIVRAA